MSTEILGESCQAVLETRTADEFRGEVVHFAQGLGFDFVSALTVIDHSLTHSEFINIDNMPLGFSDVCSDRSKHRRDPVMQHCKRGAVPIIWDQATYVEQDQGDLWEAQAAFGYRTGIAMALHFPEGRHFVLGVDRASRLPNVPGELTRLVADLQLFAIYAQEAALRLFVPRAAQPELPSLTKRELEALSWTMEGKTAWEVGAILGISERTAVLHIQNAMHKLGAVNKHQAVLKALRLGLIH
jgi:DNA-binding CsgD family transcriptional regulator